MPKPVSPIPPEDLDRIRQISEALFGAKHRLPMAVVIADAPAKAIYAEALAKPAGTTEVQAGTELRRFEQAGLLDLLPQESHLGRRGRPPKRYKKRRSDVWQFARKLAEKDEEPDGSPSGTA